MKNTMTVQMADIADKMLDDRKAVASLIEDHNTRAALESSMALVHQRFNRLLPTPGQYALVRYLSGRPHNYAMYLPGEHFYDSCLRYASHYDGGRFRRIKNHRNAAVALYALSLSFSNLTCLVSAPGKSMLVCTDAGRRMIEANSYFETHREYGEQKTPLPNSILRYSPQALLIMAAAGADPIYERKRNTSALAAYYRTLFGPDADINKYHSAKTIAAVAMHAGKTLEKAFASVGESPRFTHDTIRGYNNTIRELVRLGYLVDTRDDNGNLYLRVGHILQKETAALIACSCAYITAKLGRGNPFRADTLIDTSTNEFPSDFFYLNF